MTQTATGLRRLALPHARARVVAVLLAGAGVALAVAEQYTPVQINDESVKAVDGTRFLRHRFGKTWKILPTA